MAINLVSLVTEFLTPAVIGRVASALGVDSNKLQTAVNAAVPGLLAGLAGVAAQPGGAQKLVDAAGQHSGALDKIISSIGTGGQTTLIERESRLLTSLLGGHDQSALTDAISKIHRPEFQRDRLFAGNFGSACDGHCRQASPSAQCRCYPEPPRQSEG
jgi:hypothetical protein